MTETKKKLSLKTLFIILIMGFGYTLAYALPFIQYVFYDPLVEAMGSTNAQLGLLIMIFGWGNIFGAPIGGWLADRISAKTIYIAGLVGNGILCLLFAFNLNYSFAIFIWVGLAITGLFAIFPSHTKLVRFLGDEKTQGTVFGFAEAAAGISAVLVNLLILFVFSKSGEGVVGMRNAIIGYGIISFVIAGLLYVLIKDPGKTVNERGEEDKIHARDFLTVLKYPGTWFSGFAIFAAYTLYVSISYFTPYFTNVLGVSVSAAAAIAIVRQYLTRFIGAPVGGMLGDKWKSVLKVLALSLFLALVITFVFTKLPVGSTSVTTVTVLIILIAIFTYMARGSMFAVTTETKCLNRYAATTAGITCAIGYSPDLFQFTMFGNWLDKFGNKGYDYIFLYTMIVLVFGVISAVLAYKFSRSKMANVSVHEPRLHN